MSFHVRHAAPEDAPAIAAVARITWADTYRGIIPAEIQQAVLPQWYAEDRLARAAGNPESAFFVAEGEGGQVVGFAQAGPRKEAGDAELWRIYVLPEHQRRGIGRKLLQACLETLRARGPVNRLFVQVEAENQIGRRAYERLGFHYVREYDDEIMGHATRMCEMCLHLGDQSGGG
ncbi:MAG: GNAT family N-acetyltransferase [Symbiobacterium sp.]|uniref:N-acetyltransferase family protein n=1 Tax=Symbiobacterium sp. TaxID=1971213 RepID=UPI003464C953